MDATAFDWMPIAAGVAAILLILGIKKWYKSRPHRFTASDGTKCTWHPGYRFSEADGRAVSDPERIAQLTRDWDELHARTARQTSAIHGGRFLGD
ncbi:MAG TPA: hypothetical protein VF702_00485 [Allosphingosinicella sp.]|jgi:hypothetical protein